MVFSDRIYSVLIVSGSERFSASIASFLPVSDYYPVDTVTSVGAARRRLLDRSYDFVFINAPLQDEFGGKLAVDICNRSDGVALLFVSGDIYEQIHVKYSSYGVLTISKPTPAQTLKQHIRVMESVRERLRRREKKNVSMEERMEEIRIINRAKWLLIENLRMTEEEAHKYIEKQSMDTRTSKREIAERIIKTY